MAENKLSVPFPPALDHARLSDPAFTIRGTCQRGPVLAHYDPSRMAGGICYLVGKMWAIYGPMPFGEFISSLGARGICIADSNDLARWVEACTSLSDDVVRH